MSRAGKQQRSAESRRRVWNQLQKLEWLAGYPDGEGWQTLRGEALAIEGERVARSRRAARTAMREHADVLPALVGDVARWWGIVDATLAWCSGWISGKRQPLALLELAPARLAGAAGELARRRPELAPIIDAAAAAWAQAPAELARVIGWLTAHPEVAAFPLPHALALAQLAGFDDGEGAEALLALLALDAPHPKQSLERLNHIERRLDQGASRRKASAKRGRRGQQQRKQEKPESGVREPDEMPPVARSRPSVVAWLEALRAAEPAVARRAMELLAAARLTEGLAPWQAWEQASAPRLNRALAFVGSDHDQLEEVAHFIKLSAAVQAVRAAAPPQLSLEDTLAAVMRFAGEPALTHLHAPLVRFLAAQPAELGPTWRARLVAHLAQVTETNAHPRLGWLWDELATALERGAPARMLGPWKHALDARWRSIVDEELVEHAGKRAQVRDVVRVLVELAEQGEVSHRDASQLSDWFDVGLDADVVAEVIVRSRASALQTWAGKGLRGAAVALVGAEPAALVATMVELARLSDDQSYLEVKQLAALLRRAVAAGAGWIVRAAFAAEQGNQVAALAASVAALPRTRWPMPPGDEDPRWIVRYPDELAPALGRLASVDAEAAATAKKKLAQELPDPDDLRREIAALRQRAPLAPSLAARLANLEARLADPPRPAPARLAKLAQKLEQTAAAVGLERLAATAFAEATERLLRAFGLPAWPGDWPRDRKTLQAVQALLTLEPAERQLAARLLQARTGPPPWDLRDEPANRRFLDQLRARGLALEPWLDDAPRQVTSKGEPLELALCADPLEVFQMGGHFQTCLSPGSINFFSVVANAADVNKRVLYARQQGRVVGRCLLGLTDAGGLLAFHPYSHGSLDFTAVVTEYLRELAARMGTEVVPRGTLSTILAREWYDDGSRDLVGRFREIYDDAKLDFATIAPAALPGRLRELLGRPLDDLTLPFVLAIPGLSRRPELVLPLVPALLACSSPRVRIDAALLAMRIDAHELADRLLGEHGEAVELDEHSWIHGELVAWLRPSLTLARLRATRGRGVRSWRQESGVRLALAAVALHALHRPRQAVVMYRRAIEAGIYLRDLVLARLELLEQRLGLTGGGDGDDDDEDE